MSSIKIAVGGAHSTGKSTFLKRLAAALKDRGVSCEVVSDLASKCPLPILKDHTVESTLWIVTSGIAAEIKAAYAAKVALVDRPVVDAWAYLMAGKNGTTQNFDSPGAITVQDTIRDWLPTYDLVYKSCLDESIPVENAKGRVLDAGYRTEVARQMERSYDRFDIQSRDLSVANADAALSFALQRVEQALNS
jgi:GTPase SAR1 family protein